MGSLATQTLDLWANVLLMRQIYMYVHVHIYICMYHSSFLSLDPWRSTWSPGSVLTNITLHSLWTSLPRSALYLYI